MVKAIHKRWKRIPPLSVSVASIARGLGGKTTTEEKQEQDWSRLADTLGAAGFAGGKPEWLTKT